MVIFAFGTPEASDEAGAGRTAHPRQFVANTPLFQTPCPSNGRAARVRGGKTSGSLPADSLDVQVGQRTSPRRGYGVAKERPEADRGERMEQDGRGWLQVRREVEQNRK